MYNVRDGMRFIHYDPDAPLLFAHSDTSHARDVIHHTNTWMGIICLHGCPILHQVENFNAEISSSHCEYVGGSMTTDLLLSVQNFLMEICPNAGYQEPLEVHMDASSAIHAAVAPAMLPKYKHIPLHAQKVRTRTQLGDIILRKIETADNTADQGTKPY